MRELVAALMVIGMLLGACSGDDDDNATSSDDSSSEEASANDGDGDIDDAVGDDEPEVDAADDEPDLCVNDLAIVNADAETAATLSDGPLEAVTMWSEGGPHPDNDIDEDQNVDFGFFSYVQEPDPQFGVSIPIASEAPEGEHFLNFSLYNPDGPIAPGQRFVDQITFDDDPAADGEINFTAWYVGSTRLLISQPEITITEVNDEQICGEITSRTDTDLQQFIGVEGTFALDRSQHLEAELEAAEG